MTHDRPASPIHVTVPGSPGVVIHYVPPLHPDDVTVVARAVRVEALPAGRRLEAPALLRASAEGPIVGTIWLEPAGRVIWHRLVRHRDHPGWEYGVGDCRVSALETLDGEIRPDDRQPPGTWARAEDLVVALRQAGLDA